ncbi:MAG: MMPL family transporter [Pseudomonadota bacterium]|nr:MMPL family transporter [Pseudomonadota bacterium]
MTNFIASLIASRRTSLLLFAVLTLAIIAGAVKLTAELTGREFFAHNDGDVARLSEFTDRWGDESKLLVAVADAGSETVLTGPRMRAMAILARAIRDIDGVNGAWSLSEFPRFQKGLGGEAQHAMVLGTVPSDPSQLPGWQAAQLADPLLVPGVLSSNGHVAALVIQLDAELDTVEDLRDPVNAIEAALSSFQGKEQLRWELTGLPAIRVALLDVLYENQVMLVPLSMLLVIATLAFAYRRLYAVALPVTLGILSTLLLLGIMGWTGEPIGLLNQFYFTMIPVIVMVDAIHVIERFAIEGKSQAGPDEIVQSVLSTYAKVGIACFLTSFTTAVGFVSLGLGNIAALRHFGAYAALGILLGFVIVVTLLPLVLARIDRTSIHNLRAADTLLESMAKLVVGSPVRICVVALIAFVGFAGLATRVQSSQMLTDDLPATASATIGGGMLDRHLSGQFQFNIVIDGNGLDTYSVLNAIDVMESRWRENSMVRTVLGPGTAIRHASRGTEGGDHLPRADDDIDDYYQALLQFSELPAVLTGNGAHARIVVTAPDQGTTEIIKLGNELVEDARQTLKADDLTVNITGVQWNLYQGYAGMGADLRKSMLFALAAIMLVMSLLFRSTSVMFLMIFPNVLPLLAGYAVLAVAGWQLGIVPAVVLALAVGIVVDDSIHMLVRMREGLRLGMGPTDAVQQAILHSGRAIMISTLVLVVGFAVNGFSRFPINQTFALVGSVVLITALICDLLLLPALFLLLHRRMGTSKLL